MGAKVAGAATQSPSDATTLQLETQADESKSDKLSQRFGPAFIITFCSALIVFYLVASIIVHYAYREFKGIAEDIAGGSIDLTDGNVLHYAIIAKREDDAIEEREMLQKRAKERQAKRLGMGGDDPKPTPDAPGGGMEETDKLMEGAADGAMGMDNEM